MLFWSIPLALVCHVCLLMQQWVQVGLTDDTQYEHRVGRTGRAGKTGEALLLLADDEQRLLPLLKAFPLQPAGNSRPTTSAGRMVLAAAQQPQYGGSNGSSGGWGAYEWTRLEAGLQQVSRDDALLKSGEQAFVATLGFLAGEGTCSCVIAVCYNMFDTLSVVLVERALMVQEWLCLAYCSCRKPSCKHCGRSTTGTIGG